MDRKTLASKNETEFNLDIFKIKLYTKFQFSMYKLCEEKEGNCK